MKYIFFLLILAHALIHSLGFLKGWEIMEIKELTLPISKPYGIIWLMATVAMLLYGMMYISGIKSSWMIGMTAVILSQFLIFTFWQDAKWGSIPNILISTSLLVSCGYYQFDKKVKRETSQIFSQIDHRENTFIGEEDLFHLPFPVKNWLKQSGSIDKPIIHSGMIEQKARLKMKPSQDRWLNASAIQYSRIDMPSFIWKVEVKLLPLITLTGRDIFQHGKGEMLIKLFSLINIVNEKGEKLNEGALQRFLGEMVWFPSMALSPYISWEAIDDTTARATMEYEGTKGSGTFHFSTSGDFTKFTASRFMGNEIDSRRYNWILEVDKYKTFEGIKIPSSLTVTWELDEGEWTWLEIEITDLRYNESALS